jgi:hypothetical protein
MQVIRATSSPKRRWRAARPSQRVRSGWTAGHRSPPAATGGVSKSTPLAFCQGYTWCPAGGFTYNGIVRDGIHADFAVDDSGEPIPSFEPDGGEAGHEVCWARRDASCSGVVGLPARGGGVCRC